MLSVLLLPAVVFLIGIPGLSGLKLKRSTPQVAADSLPPVWKTASLLAVEDQFVRPSLPSLVPKPYGLRLTYDPRKLRVMVDPDSGTLESVTEFGDIEVGL